MRNCANLCNAMHVNDPILLTSLRLNITKVHVKFHFDLIGSFFRKSGTDRWINYIKN